MARDCRPFAVALSVLLLAGRAASPAAADPAAGSCYRTANYFRTHFNDTGNVLDRPTSGVPLQVCGNGKSQETCCGENSEPQLVTVGRDLYDDKLQTSLNTLSVMYKEKATKFDEYFRDMLNKARMGFHDMFKRTYGMMYEQNSYLFQDLFRDLEKYYDSGNTNIIEVLENFFSVLCQKMFTVMNSQYTFDSKYLVCVSESMSEVAPFGDVPDKLSAPLKRSFVASRTYVQALKLAGDILTNINKMMPTQECLVGFTRMTQCPACKGLQNSKACNGYCLNVMKGCLAYHSQLDQDWNAFLDIMEKVKKRLLGPFNIELVVIPINVKISEGIMNFQENAPKVSQKVFANCGKPQLGPTSSRRRRRDVYDGDYDDYQQGQVMNDGKNKKASAKDDDGDDEEDDGDDDDNEYVDSKPTVVRNEKKDRVVPHAEHGDRKKQRKNKNNNGPKNGGNSGGAANNKNRKKNNNKSDGLEDEEEDQGGPAFAFHRLLKDIGTHVASTKNFWKRLPYEVCNNEVAVIETGQNTTCWNGSALASYTKEVMRDGIKNQRRNPEVPVDLGRTSSLLNEQVFALKALTNLLKNAYQGLDVEWDMEEVFHGGESSGIGPIQSSGDGSGDEDSEPPSATVAVEGGAQTPQTPSSATTTPATATAAPPNTAVKKADDDNRVDPTTTTGTGSSAGHRPKPTLQRALAAYMLPVVAVWFGGSFLEWIL
ncbi:Glypican [Cinara cedri]|uniref:Glypican n=1 Tax=Cinara cedri TaxID=506608 RepID=A0A5E4NIA1_9HEMI|nr:Glypican [Cinara cedri]